MLCSSCTGIYKFGNNTYSQRIRRRSNLGHIFWGKKRVLWAGKYGNRVTVFVCVPCCLEEWCLTILASACLLKFKMQFHVLCDISLWNWFIFYINCQMTVIVNWWSEEWSYSVLIELTYVRDLCLQGYDTVLNSKWLLMLQSIFLPQPLVPKKSKWTSLTPIMEAAICCETLLNFYQSTYLHFPEILNFVSTAMRVSYLGSPVGFRWNFMFSQWWCCWRFKSCGMLQSFFAVVVTEVAKDRKHSSWAACLWGWRQCDPSECW
jgi:hypothetical protein